MTVRARACCRVDLAGGTLDIWPLGQLHPGSCTVNLGIDLYAEVAITPRAGEGWRLRWAEGDLVVASPGELLHDPSTALAGMVIGQLGIPPSMLELATASPRGAGLGGSSALAVALVLAGRAATGSAVVPTGVVSLVRDLEARLMGLPTGCQDQWAALLGGGVVIEHAAGGEVVRPLPVSSAIAASLVVIYTGQSHISARQNWEVVRRRLDGDAASTARFAAIAAIARDSAAALTAGDPVALGRLMTAEWRERRELASGIATPTIDALLERAAALGAWGGKACGAGGGGAIALLGPPELGERLEGELPRGVHRLPVGLAPPSGFALALAGDRA